MLLINFGLWCEGALPYLGEDVTGTESRIWNSKDVLCILERKQDKDTSRCAGE